MTSIILTNAYQFVAVIYCRPILKNYDRSDRKNNLTNVDCFSVAQSWPIMWLIKTIRSYYLSIPLTVFLPLPLMNLDTLTNYINQCRTRSEPEFFPVICHSDGSRAEHLTVESYTVVICQTNSRTYIGIPSPTHSFIPGLKPSFSANPSHCSLSFSSSALHEALHVVDYM